MAELLGLIGRLLEQEAPQAGLPPASIGPIGTSPGERSIEVTIVRRGASGAWVFGPEVKAVETAISRPLPRGADDRNDRMFRRSEFTFEVDDLRGLDLRLPATLVVAEMPPGYATVFTVPLQSAGAKDGVDNLPDAYDEGPDEPVKARFNPLGFDPADAQRLKGQGDLDAIRRISMASRDIYLTSSGHYRASLSADMVGDVLFAHHPARRESRWHIYQSSGKRRSQRAALVAAGMADMERVHSEIVLALDERRDGWMRSIARGSARIGGADVMLHPELDAYVDAAAGLAAWQALGGIDEGRAVVAGAPVSDLAGRYLQHHLNVWNQSMKRFGGLLTADDLISTPASQEDFEVQRFLDELPEIEDERVLLQVALRGMEDGHFDFSPARIDAIRRKIRRRQDELSRRSR